MKHLWNPWCKTWVNNPFNAFSFQSPGSSAMLAMTRPCRRLIWGEGRNLDNRCSVRIPCLWGQHNLQCNLYCNINQGCLKLHVIPLVQSLQFMWYGGGWGLVLQQMLVRKWGDKWHGLHGTSLQKEVTDKGSFLIEATPQQQMGKGKIWGRCFTYRRR